ncbi:hypothetical protein quinque_009970 [Culex quinquefasciatus]
MYKLVQTSSGLCRLLSGLSLGRVASCGLRHRLWTGPVRANRGDDLHLPGETVIDATAVQSATALWRKEELLERINGLMPCSAEDLERIYKVNRKTLRNIPPKAITDNVALLLERGFSERMILGFPKLLSIGTDDLLARLQIVQGLNALEDINHVAPFLNLQQSVLQNVVAISQKENIEHGNRLYYLRAKTGVEIETIARYLATSIRVYKVALEKFQQNLNYCLRHLEPLDVVKHLSILAYASSSIVERLQMLKNSPLQKVKPWMIRVPNIALEQTFEKVLEKGSDPSFKDALTELWFENHVLKRIEGVLDCTEEEAKNVFDAAKGAPPLLDNIELLWQKDIRKDTILQNAPTLAAKKEELASKVATLEKLVGLRDLNDLIPLCALKPFQVAKIVRTMNNEELPNGTNRIYHFADRAGIEPVKVAAQFSRRMFMFRVPKESFMQNLDQFIAHMDRDDVLADLWAFKYSPAVVAERIARAREVRGKKLMPWMVRCPDTVLEKSLQITKENGALLGENETIVEYFGRRLGFDRDVTNSIFLKTPSVRNVRITKVKKVIDFLLEEMGYSPHDIALNPRILMHSLQTTKKRMAHLEELGCRPRSLIVVCKSQRQYDLFVKEWLEAKERRKKAQAS